MIPLVVAAALTLALSACSINIDSGPVMTSTKEVDAGNAEMIRADIRMSAGQLKLEGGATRLLDASFRYSENLGQPVVRYDQTGFRGELTIESPKKGASGNVKNEWKLRMGAKVPLDLLVKLGAGESDLDLSTLPLRSLEVHMGAGQIVVNLNGSYTKDVEVNIHGGVGEADIRLPSKIGVIADASGGIGSIDAHNMTKVDGSYRNAAYKEGKPAIRMKVRGGVGSINLRVVD